MRINKIALFVMPLMLISLSGCGFIEDKTGIDIPDVVDDVSDFFKKIPKSIGHMFDKKDKDYDVWEDEMTDDYASSSDSMDYDYDEPMSDPYDDDVYAWLSERPVTYEDIAYLSRDERRILRNAIFARHNYAFKSDELREYFSQYSWYSPEYSDVSAQLSPIEQQNVAFIKNYE